MKTLYVFIALMVSITSVVALNELANQDTSNKVADIKQEVDWNIERTGNEEDLKVSYEVINEKATRFCISYKDKVSYDFNLFKEGHISSNIPITKLAGDFETDSRLDISGIGTYGEECFYVTYDELIGGLSFKIGWNSVLIDSLATVDSTAYGENDALCADNGGDLHAGWQGGGSDLWYGISDDSGASWAIKELLSGSVEYVGATCATSGEIRIYYLASGALYMYNSTDDGDSFTQVILESSDTFDKVSCAVDSNSVMHCCMIEAISYHLWYVNSTDVEYGFEVNDSASLYQCDIEVLENNTVIIAAGEGATDDIDLYTLGSSIGVSAYDGLTSVTSTVGEGLSIDIGFNDMIHIAGIDLDDLFYINGTYGTTFSYQELNATISNNPSLLVSGESKIYILYQDAADITGNIIRHNSSDGLTWDVGLLHVGAGFANVADSVYNTANRANFTMHYIYTDDSDVYYDGFQIGTEPPDYCAYDGVGNWNIPVACNFSNTVINVSEYGNITLQDGGSLNITNVTLRFNSTNQWFIFDVVNDEHKFKMDGNSTIN